MPDTIADVARCLADRAEAVCRYYLSNGRREGRYWLAGDVHNTPGRSLYVRLSNVDARAAGKWTDAATGEHGDLLDLIAAASGLEGIGEAVDEARRFLGLSRSPPSQGCPAAVPSAQTPTGLTDAARRLFSLSKPIAGTLASTYLRARGISLRPQTTAPLRFHPRCWYRPEADSPRGGRDAWPALIAAVTDLDGTITGIQRTWLDPSGCFKAPVAVPRRAMGQLLGHAVRFGTTGDILVAGEGIETILSLHAILPALSLAAALSATHLASLRFPPGLRRLYVVRDNDPAGRRAELALTARAQAAGIDTLTLAPALDDCNDDLRQRGSAALAAVVRRQLAVEDVIRFWRPPGRRTK